MFVQHERTVNHIARERDAGSDVFEDSHHGHLRKSLLRKTSTLRDKHIQIALTGFSTVLPFL
jgi:hypothetical protein